jgi:hypothetical protein
MHTVLIRLPCVLQLVMNWKYQERRDYDVTINISRQCRNEILNGRNSALHLTPLSSRKQGLSVKQYRMYCFCDFTDSKVTSVPLSVRNSVSSQEFSRLGAYF